MNKKLLMVASTVSPRWGSEGAVGWNWLARVPSNWSTTLLTSRECADEVRLGIEGGDFAPALVSVKSPHDSWNLKPLGRLASRVNEWAKFSYNLRSFRIEAAKLHRQHNFDVIHQTTIASWRFGMPCHDLGPATVWGPIGGGETFPWKYGLQTSAANWIFEGGRTLSGVIARRRSSIISAVRNVGVIIVTNRQTENLLRSLGRTKPFMRQPMVITRERFSTIARFVRPKEKGKIKMISGGSIEGRKGFALTIRALKELQQRGTDFEFTVTGHGMELNKLRHLAWSCGLEDKVRFETNLDTDAYIAKLAEAHFFCFPSLRDNSPVTLLEAMAARCVPIVLNNGGPAEVVDDECGVVLPLETPTKTVLKLANALADLWSNDSLRSSLSAAASRRVEESYLDDRLPHLMNEAYSQALEDRARTIL